MTRQAVSRALLAALAISLAVHLGLLGKLQQWWTPPASQQLAPGMQASLTPSSSDTAANQAPSHPPPSVDEPGSPPRASSDSGPQFNPHQTTSATTPAPATLQEPAAGEPVTPQTATAEHPPPAAAATSVEQAPRAEQQAQGLLARAEPGPYVARIARPVRRQLAASIEIRFRVLAGKNEFHMGGATYTWRVRDGRYTLQSVAEASGLAALFVSGRILQHSEGAIGEAGLRPEQYWLERKARRQNVARFNWHEGRIALGPQQGSHALPEASQDILGFPFHLALTVRESESGFSLGITNGRKIQEYRFRNLGLETLEIAGLGKQALHLQGSHAGEGDLDVWLDSRNTWLPLKIRTLDNKGEVMMLVAESISSG